MANDKLSDVLVAMNKPMTERSAEETALIDRAGPSFKDAAEAVRTGIAKLGEIGPMFRSIPSISGEYKPLRLRPLDVHESEALRGVAREGQEQRSRGIATLAVLQNISRQFDDLSLRMSKQDEQIRAHEEELARIRTGAPGRPSSMNFVVAEFEERVTQGKIEPSLADQSRVLAEWLRDNHPLAARTTAKTIENKLRNAFRRAQRQSAGVADRSRKTKEKAKSRTPKII